MSSAVESEQLLKLLEKEDSSKDHLLLSKNFEEQFDLPSSIKKDVSSSKDDLKSLIETDVILQNGHTLTIKNPSENSSGNYRKDLEELPVQREPPDESETLFKIDNLKSKTNFQNSLKNQLSSPKETVAPSANPILENGINTSNHKAVEKQLSIPSTISIISPRGSISSAIKFNDGTFKSASQTQFPPDCCETKKLLFQPESFEAKTETEAEDEEQKASFFIGDMDNRRTSSDSTAMNSTDIMNKMSKGGRRVQIIAEDKNRNRTFEVKNTKPPTFIPPDGGYGWVVAFAACFVNCFVIGFLKSYGILYISIMARFPEASAYQASWLPVCLSTLGLLIAPITGILCRKFTSRKISFIGGLLMASGIFLGAFVPTMTSMILTMGVFAGFGFGLTTTAGVLITSLYFEKRRSLASAICISGNALGSFIFPPLITYLLENYQLKGTLLILSSIQLNVCAISLLYRPISVHALVQEREGLLKTAQNEKSQSSDQYAIDNSDKHSSLTSSRTTVPQFQNSSGLYKSVHEDKKFENEKPIITKQNLEVEELHRQVSFLRTASMINSIPDLSAYARSFSSKYDHEYPTMNISRQSSVGRRSSFKKTSSKTSMRKVTSSGSLRKVPSKGSRLTLNRSALNLADNPPVDLVSNMMCPPLPKDELRKDSIGKANDLLRVSSMSTAAEHKAILLRHPSKRKRTNTMNSLPEDNYYANQRLSVAFSDTPSIPGAPPLIEEDFVSDTESRRNLSMQSEQTKAIDVKSDEEVDGSNQQTEDEEEEGEVENDEKCGWCHIISHYFDCSLMANPTFLLTLFSVIFMATGCPHAVFFLPAYMTSIGHDMMQVTMLLSITSIIDLIGRLGVGFFADLNIIPLSMLYTICSTFAGIGIILLPWVTSYAGICVLITLYNFGLGAWFVLIPTLLAKHHGPQRLAASYGLSRMFNGCTNFVSPQISGILIDVTGNYRAAFWFMGAAMAVGALVMVFEPFVTRWSNKRKEAKQFKKDLEKYGG